MITRFQDAARRQGLTYREYCDDLNRKVAQKLFGMSEAEIDAWPWGLPEFSSDFECASGLVYKICLSDAHREAFDRILASHMPGPCDGGMAEALTACVPTLICEVAILVAEQCGSIKHP